MRHFIRSLFRSAPKTIRRPDLTARLGVENLEQRWVPASIGVKTAVLDFGPATGVSTVSGVQMNLGGWVGFGDTASSGFRSLFVNTTTDRFLDLNGNGVVNQTDATLAINAIVAKVKADFAPYSLNIISDTFANQSGRMIDPSIGDVFVKITGGDNIIDSQGAFGIAPFVDVGNNTDNVVWAFGNSIVDASSSASDLVNRFARTISHEMGHSFGLAHITDTAGDTVSHHLMSAPNGNVDPRDFTRDFVFTDVSFNTDLGVQNAHEILTDTFVLGASANAWMAVLRPGELSIMGSNGANTLTVTANVGNTSWAISGVGTAQNITRTSQTLSSFNPFASALSEIHINGRGGNDTISGNFNLTSRMLIAGGDGNDNITGGSADDFILGGNGADNITGGAGQDEIFGEDGNDILRGGFGNDFLRGGFGNDQLFGDAGADVMRGDDGNDIIRGGTGDDSLFGGQGQDQLFGESGDDRLDGGDEFIPLRDSLTGGNGTDTFVQHQGLPFIFDEDSLLDRTGAETVVNV